MENENENENENEIKDEDIIKGYFNIVMNFEAFGSSPDFTTPIQEFLYNNCSKIEEAKQSGEQSLNNYMLFKKYSELMDKTLEKFLDMGNLEPEVIFFKTYQQNCHFFLIIYPSFTVCKRRKLTMLLLGLRLVFHRI